MRSEIVTRWSHLHSRPLIREQLKMNMMQTVYASRAAPPAGRSMLRLPTIAGERNVVCSYPASTEHDGLWREEHGAGLHNSFSTYHFMQI